MNKALTVWQLISESLRQNIPVMLLYVLQSQGSSPGRQGFAMAVTVNGAMGGSIGGGIMEHKFVELAKEKLLQQEQEILVRKQFHDKKAAKDQSGMICSGEQTILLYRVQPKDSDSVQKLTTCLQQNQNGLLQLSPSGIQFLEKPSAETDFAYTYQSENDWMYQEKVGFKNHLYIIGGGHCALAFSRLMSTMDFCIHLYEDRLELNTFLENEYAHEKTVVGNYSELKELIPSGENHYVVIMTVGYRTDDLAIRALWDKPFKYIGVLGSQKKMEQLLGEYLQEGVDADFLKNIHTPIGLPIHSQTPEEIAISIAAQIIQIKNQKETTTLTNKNI